MDGIIVYGYGKTMQSAIQDHDHNLKAVLQRACEVGIKLNEDKLKLARQKLSIWTVYLPLRDSVLI